MVAYSAYTTREISSLREMQNNLVDRNRKDSLQLLRIQNDLNSLAIAMRDMLDNDEPYPLTAWSAQFQSKREDLEDRAPAGGAGRRSRSHPGPKEVPQRFCGAVLGRSRPHVQPGPRG